MARTKIGNFKGPKGDKGDKGDQGIQGIQGIQGPTGTFNSNAPVEFSEATTDVDIASGDTVGAVFGKILKRFNAIKKSLSDLTTAVAGKAAASHNHTKGQITDLSSASVSYASSAGSAAAVEWSGVTGKPSTYTPATHYHDDRYFTESEINTKLAEKYDAVRIQRGYGTSDVITFPTAFSAVPGAVIVVPVASGSIMRSYNVYDVTKNGFKVSRIYFKPADGSSGGAGEAFYWIAIL